MQSYLNVSMILRFLSSVPWLICVAVQNPVLPFGPYNYDLDFQKHLQTKVLVRENDQLAS